MKIVDNKALVLRLKNPAPVLAAVPDAHAVDEHTVAVRWGITQAQALRSLRLNAPSPIEGRYRWPGKFKPMSHQRETAAFLTLHRRAFCFSEQGTGKTGSAIWAADYLLSQRLIRRVLVICPVSIMDAAWRSDLFSVAMHRSVDVAHGSVTKRRKVIASGAEFVIINYDGVAIVRDELIAGGFDLIIVDEASHYSNAQTARWKALRAILTDDTWLWMMTGTPAAQSPTQAYGLAKLVNPGNVPRTFSSFRDMVMYKITQFKWGIKDTAVDTVHRVLQPAIRFSKMECLDLPEMVYARRNVPLSKQQQHYYEQLRKQMMLEAAGEQVTATNAAVVMTKLLQISCGSVYSDDQNTLQFDISGRYSALREVLDETPRKVLIFVPFKHTIKVVAEALTKDGFSCDVINGEVKPSDRTEIFRRFQTEPDPRILVIQPQAAAHGVTLTAADTVVWWGPVTSLEIYAQANARVHRKGQTNRCTVVQLVGSPVERRVYEMLDNKIDIHTQVIELYKNTLDLKVQAV
jgi:SNF2 family DNA or RNA helicase